MEESILNALTLVNKTIRYSKYSNAVSFFSKSVKYCIKELDNITKEYVAQHSKKNGITVVSKNENCDSSAEIERVIKTLTESEMEKQYFLNVFLIWKDLRQETIECLRAIAKELKEMEDHTNLLNGMASVSGIASGSINIARMVMDNIPVPGYIAPALSAINGALRFYTSGISQPKLESLSKKAEEAVIGDKMLFERMMKCFTYNDAKVMDSVKSAIGSPLYILIFVKLKPFYDEMRSSYQRKNLKELYVDMVTFLVKLGYDIDKSALLADVSLKMLIAFSSILSLDWFNVVSNGVGILGKSGIYGGHCLRSIKEMAMLNGETSINAGTYAGIIFDVGPAILDLSRCFTTNGRAANIKKHADALEEEKCKIEYIYRLLKKVEDTKSRVEDIWNFFYFVIFVALLWYLLNYSRKSNIYL